MINLDEEDDLRNQPWHEIFNHLLKVATLTVRQYRNLHVPVYEPSDYVQDVIEKILKEERKWNPVRYPSFKRWATMCLISHIKNEVKRKKNRDTSSINDHLQIEKTYSAAEQADHATAHRITDDIRETLCESENWLEVFEKMLDGLQDQQISGDLDIPIEVVRNAKKRVRERARKVYQRCKEAENR